MVGDYNHDGRLDLATANSQHPGTVSVLLARVGGGYEAHQAYPAGARPASIAQADFDGDGRLDLVVANATSPGCAAESVTVLRGLGDGTFAPKVSYPGECPPAVAAADSMATTAPTWSLLPRGVGVYLAQAPHQGNIVLATAQPYATGYYGASLAIADLDRDTFADIVVGHAAGDTEGVSILLGGGPGGYFPATHPIHGTPALGVAIGDLNGDSRPDVVAARMDDDAISVLLSEGTGYEPPATYAAGRNPVGVALGDVNADGRVDVVVADFGDASSGNGVTVFAGRGDGTLRTAAPLAAARRHPLAWRSPISTATRNRARRRGRRRPLLFRNTTARSVAMWRRRRIVAR